MTRYKFKPKAEISTVVTGGEELRLLFDAKGICEVPDDFQEATAFLESHPKVKRLKE
jgi:hypothetical protein